LTEDEALRLAFPTAERIEKVLVALSQDGASAGAGQ